MRLLIQRVINSSVDIDGKRVAEIGKGLLVLVGVGYEDNEKDVDLLAKKACALRIFDDENGVMNKSLTDIKGEMLAVSQFTLMANAKKGNRPSYIQAAKPDISKPLYEMFCQKVSNILGRETQKGVFGADMKVGLINDGPVTIWLDSKEL